MAKDVVKVVNEIGKQEGMPDGIQIHNIHYESTLSDLYADKVGHKGGDSWASDKDWKGRNNPEINLKNFVTDVPINNDEVDNLVNNLNNKDAIHFNDGFGNIEDFVNDGVQHAEDNQQHHFYGPIVIEGDQHDHFGGTD